MEGRFYDSYSHLLCLPCVCRVKGPYKYSPFAVLIDLLLSLKLFVFLMIPP